MRDLINIILEAEAAGLKPYKNSETFKGMTSLASARAAMEQLGFTQLSYGFFSRVFAKPGLDYLIKIFENDPSYLAYVRFALSQHSNPYCPKYRGRFMKLSEQIFAVRIQRLSVLASNEASIVSKAAKNLARHLAGSEPLLGSTQSFCDAHPGFSHTLGALNDLRLSKGFYWDLNVGNFMCRDDGQLVITDPFKP